VDARVAKESGPSVVVFVVQFNRFSRLGLVILLLGPIVLAVAALTGVIPLPRIAEHVVDLLVGIELVLFSLLNVRYELTRRWLKGPGPGMVRSHNSSCQFRTRVRWPSQTLNAYGHRARRRA
jgi:hypothetical protein